MGQNTGIERQILIVRVDSTENNGGQHYEGAKTELVRHQSDRRALKVCFVLFFFIPNPCANFGSDLSSLMIPPCIPE